MKSKSSFRLQAGISLLVLLVMLAMGVGQATAQDKKFTLKDILMSGKFYGKRVRGFRWMKDGTHYLTTNYDKEARVTNILIHAVDSGEESVWVDGASLVSSEGDTVRFSGFTLSPDESRVLFAARVRRIWRRSTTAKYYVYVRETGEMIDVSPKEGEIRNAKFSPDGKKVGFVRDDDLYVFDIESRAETRLTSSAAEAVYNGRFGWVYEEEFGISDGFRWSPDSKRIAFWHEDETNVPIYNLTDVFPLHSEVTRLRYPKPGDPNPVEKIGVVDVETGKTVWMDLGTETDIYIPRIWWTKDPGVLAVLRLNRLQNHLEFLLCSAADGASRVLFEETSPGWIDVHDNILFLNDRRHFLWTSDRNGWNHIYEIDLRDGSARQVTRGKFDVRAVEGLDGDEEAVFFTATLDGHIENNLYVQELDDDDPERLTEESGTHRVNVAPGGEAFLDTWSNVRTPSQTALKDDDGDIIRTLIEPKNPYEDYGVSTREFLAFETSDGVSLTGSIMKPADFDPDRQYPVLMVIYGGPGSQTVYNSWISTWHQYLAQHGYIVFQVDPRGTAGKGRAYKFMTYRKLGITEAGDFIEAAKYLRSLPFVDAGRIGIWGWSYGGYMAAMTMLVGSDYFKAGIAVAPVTDWKFYDTIYAERYMQRPEDNPKGYEAASCMTYADKLKGKLLIVHGAMDDNVHLQNTFHLIDALERAGKQFSMRIYPRGNHGIGGGKVRLNLYEMFDEFLSENL